MNWRFVKIWRSIEGLMFFVLALALSGLFLIYLEFFLPGAIMAIGGGVLLLASIFMFHMLKEGSIMLLAYLMALSMAVYATVKIAKWRIHSAVKHPANLKEMIGKRATTATDLTPVGHIFIDDQVFEALAKNGPILKGIDVVVIDGDDTRLIVQTTPPP